MEIEIIRVAVLMIIIIVALCCVCKSEGLTNINYDAGRGASMSALELTQPGQIGPTGHGDYMPSNLSGHVNYPRYKDDLSMLYDDGSKYIIQNGLGGYTEDALRLNLLERSRFSDAFKNQQA